MPTYLYSYNNSDDETIYDDFVQWLQDVNNEEDPAWVQSVSYGAYGTYPNATVQRISNEFLKITARGVSILFASGDDGVGCNDAGTRLEAPYPSSPWVTLVGSTVLFQNGTELGAGFSSGGFSDDFWQPRWQAEAVNAYLQKSSAIPPLTWFNASGRALPDVGTCGVNGITIVNGGVSPASGTSMSSPLFGGMISLLNNMRLNQGKKTLGFLNPWLYKTALNYNNAFEDIVLGNNAESPCPGFNNTAGWNGVVSLVNVMNTDTPRLAWVDPSLPSWPRASSHFHNNQFTHQFYINLNCPTTLSSTGVFVQRGKARFLCCLLDHRGPALLDSQNAWSAYLSRCIANA